MRLFFIACFIFLYTCGFSQTQTTQHKEDTTKTMTMFLQVNVVDVETGQIREEQDVVVDNHRIVSIRKHGKDSVKKQQGLSLIPARGMYLVPGLVDCHTHICYKEDLAHYLNNGVTTVFSLGQPEPVLQLREAVNKGTLDGPTIYAAAMIDTVPQDWENKIFNFVVHSPADVDTAMRVIRKKQYDFIKVYNSLTTQEFDEIMHLSASYSMPVIGHGVRQPGMEHILSKGMAMVAHGEEYLYTVFKDSLDESKIPGAVAFTKKYGAFVCPNLSTFQTMLTQWGDSLKFAGLLEQIGDVQHLVSPAMLDFWMNNNHYIHRTGSPLVPMYPFLKKLTYALHKAGVPLVAGTDSPVIPGCLPGYSLITELQLLTEAGLTNADALKTATLVPSQFMAKYLPRAPKTGLVKEGFQADLLLLSGNPFDNVQNLRKVVGVMAKGKWYAKEQSVSL